MIDPRLRLPLRLLAALALAATTACPVAAGGQIPCVAALSCPSDYPVCSSGKCVAGTSTATGSISILGVPGKAATDPVGGTITVQVSARAASGVKSISLAGGGKTFSPAAGATGPVFNVNVDTAPVAAGYLPFTAALRPG